MNHILRQYSQQETVDHGECVVTLKAIGWELYAIEVNGYEERRIVGLDNAMNALEDEYNPDSPDWTRIL